MENEQTLKDTRISFLHKFFQKTLKNTKIRILYPKKYDKHTYHFTMEHFTDWNFLLYGIFKKHFYIFVRGSTYCKTYCGENNCILFSYPAYKVETIKTCSKIVIEYSIDQIIVNNNLT